MEKRMLLWGYLKDYKKLLFLALLLATINQVFSLLDPQVFRLLIDNYASKSAEMPKDVFLKGVFLLLLAFVGVAFVSRVAKNFQDYFVSAISQRIGARMYAHSVEHTFSLPYDIFEDRRSGELLQKLQKARIDSQTMLVTFVNVVFLSLIGMIFVITYAFTVHWSIGLTYFLLIPILGTTTFILSRRIRAAQKDIVTESAELAGSTTETIRNVELVKSLGLEGQEISRLNKVNNAILELELKKIRMIRKLSFVQGTLINATRAILVLLMLWLIFNQNITLGEFFSLFVYSFFIFSPLAEFGNFASQYQEARASNENLREILNLKPKAKPENAVKVEKLKEIEFKDVDFKYSSADSASIKNVNLKIKAGETVAFVGPSGSGKTTLVKLLVGLYDNTKGTISFNNLESKKIDYENLRKRIGLVSQETQLFAGTVRENLLFVNPNANDKQCMEVLKMAAVTGILERGGKGLDTKIGEGGIKLSGGERQRLAIARALLRNPDLIIFDEATSSLDSITEKEITKTIENITKFKPGLISVLIAHRLSTVARADRIYVLEKGKIVESGTHNQLLKKKGLYHALWMEQSAEGSNGKR